MRISEDKRFDGAEIAMRCDLCGKLAFGPRQLMSQALEEHRRVCTKGHAEDQRMYELTYPRKDW